MHFFRIAHIFVAGPVADSIKFCLLTLPKNYSIMKLRRWLFFANSRSKNLGVLTVKRKKGLRILTVLILLFIFLFPAYSCYFTLVETNLFSADISYESPDQDGLSTNPESEFRGFVANAPSVFFFPGDNLFKWLLDFPCQTLSTAQRPLVLRC